MESIGLISSSAILAVSSMVLEKRGYELMTRDTYAKPSHASGRRDVKLRNATFPKTNVS